jgi:hypothetical protein
MMKKLSLQKRRGAREVVRIIPKNNNDEKFTAGWGRTSLLGYILLR